MDFQLDVLDKVALVVGGTVSPTDPRFFSGALAQDNSGIAGVMGCYSAPPAAVNTTPLGILLLDNFDAELEAQGAEPNADYVRLLLLIAPYVSESQMAKLIPYRDLVPAAFRTHMQLYSAPSAMDAFVMHGQGGIHEWASINYLSFEFRIRIRRELAVTYQS